MLEKSINRKLHLRKQYLKRKCRNDRVRLGPKAWLNRVWVRSMLFKDCTKSRVCMEIRVCMKMKSRQMGKAKGRRGSINEGEGAKGERGTTAQPLP
jgi:hypothetical protein